MEPEANGISCLIVGRCQESSREISAHRSLGNDRELHSVWTLPLHPWQAIMEQFFEPDFAWHTSSRLRILVALCCVYGYDETIARLGEEVHKRLG